MAKIKVKSKQGSASEKLARETSEQIADKKRELGEKESDLENKRKEIQRRVDYNLIPLGNERNEIEADIVKSLVKEMAACTAGDQFEVDLLEEAVCDLRG